MLDTFVSSGQIIAVSWLFLNKIMQITILQIGKTKHSFFQEAEAEYLKRLQPFVQVKVVTLAEEILPNGSIEAGREKVKNAEAQKILKNIPHDSMVIALDERGKNLTSVQFADLIKSKQDFGPSQIVFIIGGPYGLAAEILARAELKLSFSSFTFTHEMIRVLLLEQIYRAFTILKGKTYHY